MIHADERDRILAPVADVLLAAAAPSPGSQILDIGCGCGVTSLAAASRVGDDGTVTGVDLSVPMLDVARRRARAAGATNISFVPGDVQTHEFAPNSIDLVISRFGTMFFSDPLAAFANVRTALRPGGRLCLATWQPLVANEWLVVPGAALLEHTEMPNTDPTEPGMFAQSDPATVTATLTAAGFTDVVPTADEVTFTLGDTVETAAQYLADTGPGRALLETIADGPARDAALDDVRRALATHRGPSGVQLNGAIWLTTAVAG